VTGDLVAVKEIRIKSWHQYVHTKNEVCVLGIWRLTALNQISCLGFVVNFSWDYLYACLYAH
jgi:hypothetical protein